MRFDPLTRGAITHTLHCLIGCGIGEILGSAIGAWRGWPNIWQTILAVALAFTFGYGLTFLSARRQGMSVTHARQLALRTDTISIVSMEIIDNTLEWIIPGAMNAAVNEWLFWWSMALSLTVAFICTVPVNRWLMARRPHHHHH